jgi:hypothetical protein
MDYLFPFFFYVFDIRNAYYGIIPFKLIIGNNFNYSMNDIQIINQFELQIVVGMSILCIAHFGMCLRKTQTKFMSIFWQFL